MMSGVFKILAGFSGGFFVGVLGVAVHAGPVDKPIIGLLLGFIMIASGSWFLLANGWDLAWLGALVAVAAATVWLLMFPPANDSFISVDQWVSQVWLLLAPVAVLLPAAWVSGRKGRAHE